MNTAVFEDISEELHGSKIDFLALKNWEWTNFEYKSSVESLSLTLITLSSSIILAALFFLFLFSRVLVPVQVATFSTLSLTAELLAATGVELPYWIAIWIPGKTESSIASSNILWDIWFPC